MSAWNPPPPSFNLLDPAYQTEPPGTSEQPYVEAQTASHPRRVLAAVSLCAAVAIVGAIVGVLVLLGNQGHRASYASEVSTAVRPLLEANATLTGDVNSLKPGTNANAAIRDVGMVQQAVRSVQQSFGQLKPPASGAALTDEVNAVLTSEQAWLQAASAVLASPSSPLLSQLAGLGVDAQTKLQALATTLPGAPNTSFPESNQIVQFAAAANAAAATQAQALAAQAQTNEANVTFSNQVGALLAQSGSSFQAINNLYQQLQSVASGGDADITIAEAEQQIGGIVANRTSLQAAAQALSAPSGQATTVHDDLVSAFNASLKDDNDLDTCLNQANFGSVAYIFQSCLDSSADDSQAATSAKQQFLQDYNVLRTSLGQPALDTAF